MRRVRRLAGLAAGGLLFAAPSAAQDRDLAKTALSLVNEARAAEGLTALELEPALMNAAQAHADDMLARDYYSHQSPEGEGVRGRFLDAGGSQWNLVAENIASCVGCEGAGAERVRGFQSGWMQSPGHRENILMPGLDGFGFGMAAEAGTVYAVQTFAGPGTSPGVSEGSAGPAELERVRSDALEAVNAARRQAGKPPLEASGELAALAEAIAERVTMEGESLSMPRDPFALLPEGAGGWTGLAVSAAACTGCGASPAAGDGAHFGGQLAAPEDARGFTRFGFALTANGEGRKIAVGVFGRR